MRYLRSTRMCTARAVRTRRYRLRRFFKREFPLKKPEYLSAYLDEGYIVRSQSSSGKGSLSASPLQFRLVSSCSPIILNFAIVASTKLTNRHSATLSIINDSNESGYFIITDIV